MRPSSRPRSPGPRAASPSARCCWTARAASSPAATTAACRTAISTLHVLAAARDRTASKYGIDKVRLGIGIWLGGAAAGELGPKGAVNFGVAGTAIESAATLRALGRTYRTSILVNDGVKRTAERAFRFRPLDPIAIHGSEKSEIIHELVGEIGIIMPQLPRYLAARAAYIEGDFERAAHLFGEVLREHPHDGPSRLFLRRAKTLIKSPPKANWLGVWQG